MSLLHEKVTSSHLKRGAYLYIRQSSLKQIQFHQESTKRQYALRQQAIKLGWSIEQIHVIDQDQGRSGAQAKLREGFQYLVSQVSLNKAGIVMGLEVSRLARNSSDWHRLLEICALTDTLILDEDGTYDPKDFNDRLVLGLKGTMSEAELHMLRARLQGGMMNKAKRGELKLPLPIGFTYDEQSKIALEPDQQLHQSIQQLFSCFERKQSACAVVKTFDEKGWLFPQRIARGINKGDILWGKITHSRVLQILHNPCYAGAYAYGRRQIKYLSDGESRPRVVPQADWLVLIKEAHQGYITWEQYESNQTCLKNNARSYNFMSSQGTAREGNALLQGLIICGACGQKMTVRYHMYKGNPSPDYICQREGIQKGKSPCQSLVGKHIDQAISEWIIELMSPVTLELSIAVQKELEQRWQESDKLWQQQMSQARYQSDLAKRRYMKVDPDNRLVADTLEADWNIKLNELDELQQRYGQYQKQKLKKISTQQQKKIKALSKDFSLIWNADDIAMQERKRMIRLLIDDVTLKKTTEHIEVHIRLKGGQIKSMILPHPKNITELRKTNKAIIHQIKLLSETMTDKAIAITLNKQGISPCERESFSLVTIQRLRQNYNIKSFYQHLRDKGYLTAKELGATLDICAQTVYKWLKAGLLNGFRASDRNEYLFELPAKELRLKKITGSPLKKRLIMIE